LATASEGDHNNVRVWQTATGTLVRTLDGHKDTVWSVAWSRDASRVVTASRDQTGRIWDPVTGDVLLTVDGNSSTLVSAVISPDGHRLATGSRDGTVQVWDAATGDELLTLGGKDVGDGINALALTPDGRQLVVRKDQAVRTYALPIEDVRTLVQSRLTRWWTLEECRRFLHVDQCPRTPAHPVAAQPVISTVPEHGPPVRRVVAPVVAPRVVAPVPAVSAGSSLTGTLKIVSSLPRTGAAKNQTDTIINAFTMALEEHGYRAGNATLFFEDMDDATAVKGFWDAPTEAANANRAANDLDVMVYLGPYTSGAARVSAPILCPTRLAMISPSNTYPGLTKQTAYNTSGEPDVYYPNCPRNYARVAATDDLQGAVGAQLASRLGASKVYVLHDSDLYGQGLADVFADSARRLGLDIVGGPEGIDPAASDYRALAEKVRRVGPDVVYFGGAGADRGAGRLWKDLRSVLGDGVKLVGPDGINDSAFIDAAGAAAEGTYATFPGVPASKLTGKGAEWYQRYKQRFQVEPEPYAAYGYEAMNVAIAAIERAGKKDRAAVRDAVLATHDYSGILGTWSFTPTGDTTLVRMSVRQVRNGKWDDSTVQVVEAVQ
jgi:branched-chain amino acid transport system substrate-binding protein